MQTGDFGFPSGHLGNARVTPGAKNQLTLAGVTSAFQESPLGRRCKKQRSLQPELCSADQDVGVAITPSFLEIQYPGPHPAPLQ